MAVSHVRRKKRTGTRAYRHWNPSLFPGLMTLLYPTSPQGKGWRKVEFLATRR
jgi:hypothetical protein